ncbi:MAG: protein jag [Epulopiscium sp.]|nr:protein jag [Candidatus Epulonipiscium sp.]
MKFVEKIGKTVDDAITEALVELMVTRDNVDIEILEKGSKGFLGIGAKDAKVRVSVKEKDKEVILDEPVLEEPTISIEKDDASDLINPAQIGEEFLAEILEKMGVEAEIETKTSKNQIDMNISGEKMGLIIGKRGETLDAIQYLVNLAVNKNTDTYTRVIIDTENYRKRREETLRKLANRLAKRAAQTNQKVVLEPMNPYDRRIIHAALQKSKIARTYSEGKEPYRRVVIVPKNDSEHNKK